MAVPRMAVPRTAVPRTASPRSSRIHPRAPRTGGLRLGACVLGALVGLAACAPDDAESLRTLEAAQIAGGPLEGPTGERPALGSPGVAPDPDAPPGHPDPVAPTPHEVELLPPFVVDRTGEGGELWHRELPVPSHADVVRALDAWFDDDAGRRELGRVLDARLDGRGGVWIVRPDGRLVHRARVAEAAEREVAVAVDPPLAVAPEADLVAFATGHMPDFEIVVLEGASGAVRWRSSRMAPAWTPALDPDGERLLFVSGVEGAPALWSVTLDGDDAQPRRLFGLDEVEALPMGPFAPQTDGSHLRWDDRDHAWSLDLDTGAVTPLGPSAARDASAHTLGEGP